MKVVWGVWFAVVGLLVPMHLVSAAGPTWLNDDLKAAIKEAAGKKPIIVLTHADWCSPCKQLTYEVIESKAGKRLLKGAVGVRINFETKAGRHATTKFRVLGLPTTLVLSPKGEEIGRVVGYPGKRAYQQTLKDLLAGKSDLARLKKAFQATPNDPKVMIPYAQSQLVRGKIKAAKALLFKAMKQKNAKGAWATRVWGRYLIRVKQDGKRGAAHFHRAMKAYKGTPYAKSFLYWAAKGYLLQKQEARALGLFDAWRKASPTDTKALVYQADFMIHNKLRIKEAEAMVRQLLKHKPQSAWFHYMLSQTRLLQQDKRGALAAVQRAMKLAPRVAIFKYQAKRCK